VEPAGQQVAIRAFDKAGAVVVPGFGREKKFRFIERFRRAAKARA